MAEADIELGIATGDKALAQDLLAAFPDADVRFNSGFGYVAIVATVLVPTATLAIRVAEFLYARNRDKQSEDEIVSIRYRKTKGYVEISAKGIDEAEVLSRLRAIDGDPRV